MSTSHIVLYALLFLLFAFLVFLTEADLLPGVGREQEDQQGHGGEEHTGDEKVESIEQSPPP